jgi:hypothetical protein
VSNSKLYQIIDTTTIIPVNFISTIMQNYSIGPAYLTFMTTTFEGSFPFGSWELIEDSPGDYRWGKRDCNAYNGIYSGWAVGGGTDGNILPCGSNYPNYADSYMTYGPFSTEIGYLSGEVKFRMYINTETGFDYLWVVAGNGGTNEWGYKVSGNSGGWLEGTLNLNNLDGLGSSVIGFPKVWIRFRFTSDYLVSVGEGVFVDDIVLRMCTATSCTGTYSPALSTPLNSGSSELLFEPVMITLEP